MKIFIDTEFYEFQPTHPAPVPVVGHHGEMISYTTRDVALPGANAVQLISLGAVREDGAEFYAENSEFDWNRVPAGHWIHENVYPHLTGDSPSNLIPKWSMLGNHDVHGGYWAGWQIAHEFFRFALATDTVPEGMRSPHTPEFWGYYCDYDWVVLCGLYGRMVDLPPEFPKFCLDLKQLVHDLGNPKLPRAGRSAHHALEDAREVRDWYTYIQYLCSTMGSFHGTLKASMEGLVVSEEDLGAFQQRGGGHD